MLTKAQFQESALNILQWPVDMFEAIREILTGNTAHTASIAAIKAKTDTIGTLRDLTPTIISHTTGTHSIPIHTKAFTITNHGAAVDCTVGGIALAVGTLNMPLGDLHAALAVVHGATPGTITIIEWN